MGRLSPFLAGLVAASAVAAPARAEEGTIVLQERVPLAFFLSTPTGDAAQTRTSDLIRLVDDLFQRETNFALVPFDASVVTECRGRLGCLTTKARRDYQRSDLVQANGAVVPYREHVRRLRRDRTPYARYLLVLANVSVAGEADRLSAVLVDTDRALEVLHHAPQDRPDWQDEAEAQLNEVALAAPPARAQVRGPEETRAFLDVLLYERLKPTLEQNGHWRPYGRIELSGTAPGVAVLVDGDTVGTTAPDRTSIDRVTPGTRVLELSHPDYAPFSADVGVVRGETSALEVQLTPLSRDIAPAVRTATMWSGAALAVAGAALAGWALVRQDGEVGSVCFRDPGGLCRSGSSFQSFGYDPGAADPRAIHPGGVLVAPLGLGLAGAGATLGVGALLTAEDEIPWLPVLVGVGVGVLTYGLAAALDGPRL